MAMKGTITATLNNTETKGGKKMKNKSSMKRGVVVSTEVCPDMVPLYVQLLDTYKDRPERCPTIYVVDEIMNGISYLKNADVLLLKQGSRLERAMKSDNYPYNLKLCSFGNSAETIYSVALHVCSRQK
jgi:hypothetical protein